jgi:hypothetical protein
MNNLTPFQFIVAALATYRISLLFSKESGPARIFAKLRKAPPKKSATAEWLSCLFCFSMTASAVVCLGLWLADTHLHYAEWFLTWCALSAVAIVINQRFTKGDL